MNKSARFETLEREELPAVDYGLKTKFFFQNLREFIRNNDYPEVVAVIELDKNDPKASTIATSSRKETHTLSDIGYRVIIRESVPYVVRLDDKKHAKAVM